MKTSNLERSSNYVILIAFALFALGPMFTIVKTALGPENADAVPGTATTIHWATSPRPGAGRARPAPG